jgi:hypothetical protein
MSTDNQDTKQVVVPSKELLTALSSIQLASSRGAFRPEEFVEIGTAYQKLYQFLVDLNVITPPQSDQAAPPSA